MTTLDILRGAGKTAAESLDPGQIRVDGGTQMRMELHPATIAEYAEAMVAGAHFPDIIVYYDGEHYWLGDGFHRLEAHKRAWGSDSTRPTIGAEVRSGTRRDAVLHAAGANADHGLRRTNADKRRAVETLLRDEEWAKWSDREIARACNVSADLVGTLRKGLAPHLSIPTDANITRTVQRNGQTYTMQTANIGAQRAEHKAPTPTRQLVIEKMRPLAEQRQAQAAETDEPEAAATPAPVFPGIAVSIPRKLADLGCVLRATTDGNYHSYVPVCAASGAAGRPVGTGAPAVYFNRHGSVEDAWRALNTWKNEKDAAASVPARPHDAIHEQRIKNASTLRGLMMDVLNYMDDYSRSTGHFGHVVILRRALDPMIAELDSLLVSLQGQ